MEKTRSGNVAGTRRVPSAAGERALGHAAVEAEPSRTTAAAHGVCLLPKSPGKAGGYRKSPDKAGGYRKSPGKAGGYLLLACSPALLSRRRSRRGVTLLELLVVMLILLMVTAAALPIVVPAMQNRQMRESARLVSSYFSVARSRAIEIGRPVGVMVERFNGQPFGIVLSQVEVPPPYSGDLVESQMQIDPTSGKITYIGSVDSMMMPVAPDELWKGLVRYGDLVKLNYKGPPYILASVEAGMMPTAGGLPGEAVPNPPGGTFDWFLQSTALTLPLLPQGTATLTLPYQIIRRPVRSSTAPLQLPEGIVVDLVSSGMGSGYFGVYAGTTWSVAFDPVILFSPSGRLEAVSQLPSGILAHPSDAVYVLLGRRELMPDITATQIDRNLSDLPTSPGTMMTPPPHFWVSVGYQTGLVTVAEVASNSQDPTMFGAALAQARLFARQSQSVGGR